MHIYDLSVALSDDVPTYPGDPGIKISPWFTLAGGDQANVSLLHFGAHTGTHVDAPAHFAEANSVTISLAPARDRKGVAIFQPLSGFTVC